MKISKITPLTEHGLLHPSAFILHPFHSWTAPTLRSPLTRRAVKRAPVADGDALDDVRANPAFLSVPVVNPQMVLKLAALVVSIAVIGKRRTAPADRVAEQIGNGSSDRLNPLSRQAVGPLGRPDAAQRKNLVGVNVAESRDDLLIEQKIANAPLRRSGEPKQIFRRESWIERI